MGDPNCYTMPVKVDSNTAESVRREVLELVRDQTDLTLDFGQTTYISSAGLRVVLILEKKVRAAGGELELRNVKQQILEIFELTGLAGVVRIT
ncbi:MAG: STAS domain-containing protein [Peptococcaceae bacterium]|nr:STAS domain-containing protein [Peptococcaceae bacterium]